VTAPGVDIVTAAPGGAYAFSSGTSLAAAHVSGAIALLLQARPHLTPEEIRAVLVSRARDLGAPGADSEFGAGFADALAIVGSDAAPSASTPAAEAVTSASAESATAEKAPTGEAALSPAAHPAAPAAEGSSTR
jgi:subtilisin family serine protease